MITIFSKVFLTLVGLMYLVLAIWCSVDPKTTSDKVGFDIRPGSGQSEYLVIYGGLELALALLFLIPILNSDFFEYSLLACLIVHGCLVAFRTASYFMFENIAPFTLNLAIGEWVILLASAALYLFVQRGT